MKNIFMFICAGTILISACDQAKNAGSSESILIDKSFSDENTYVIVCKGYPKEGKTGIQADETAKETALLNAQVIARQTFDESVDVVKNGNVKNYKVMEGYAVVQYVITVKGLNKKLKPENPGNE